MTSTVNSSTPKGIHARPISIECDLTKGLPGIVIVGMGSKSIEESKERIKSALMNSKLQLPRRRITINLAPADIRKEGACLDLAMAVAILTASEQVPASSPTDMLFVGELSLSGQLKPVKGIIGHVIGARHRGLSIAVVPQANAQQAAMIEGITVLSCGNIKDLYLHLLGQTKLSRAKAQEIIPVRATDSIDFSDVHGQRIAKRGLEIAAAGGHNILMSGPPGGGKTMLARAFNSILPPPSVEEAVEITSLHSLHQATDLITQRPFRSPHHTSSSIALIGGGQNPKPGEISLAHKGVLFLDEIAEYPRSVLEALRQPLEDKIVSISRAQESVEFPADFILIATQNPCPCGFYGDNKQDCICLPYQIMQYQKRLSGPLLDRFDLHINTKRVETEKLLSNTQAEASSEVLERVQAAMLLQAKRFNSSTVRNSGMSNRQLRTYARINNDCKKLLELATDRLNLSARGYMRTLKVARTIADLEASEQISATHISEALTYREARKAAVYS